MSELENKIDTEAAEPIMTREPAPLQIGRAHV